MDREPFPPLFIDVNRIHDIAEWDQELLEEKASLYGRFICSGLMPRAKKQTEYILDNILFELAWREGLYE
jgi:hypothetical protein